MSSPDAPRPRLSVTLVGLHKKFGPDPRVLVEVARMADGAGVDQIALSDHVVMGRHTELYPYGRFPFPPEDPWPEPLTVLAAMAAVTSRIRLATGVLIAPLRPAALLAKSVATLDALSGGRVDLGVGIGWQEEEYGASGVPFSRRWSRIEDTLRACRALWRDVPATFHSETVNFDDIYCTPLPAQSRIPIWFGAKATEAVARRIVELGDGWAPLATAAPDVIRDGLKVIRAACAEAGRDPAEIGVRCGLALSRDAAGKVDWPRVMADVAPLVGEGVTVLALLLGPGLDTLADAKAYLEDAAAAFRRALG